VRRDVIGARAALLLSCPRKNCSNRTFFLIACPSRALGKFCSSTIQLLPSRPLRRSTWPRPAVQVGLSLSRIRASVSCAMSLAGTVPSANALPRVLEAAGLAFIGALGRETRVDEFGKNSPLLARSTRRCRRPIGLRTRRAACMASSSSNTACRCSAGHVSMIARAAASLSPPRHSGYRSSLGTTTSGCLALLAWRGSVVVVGVY